MQDDEDLDFTLYKSLDKIIVRKNPVTVKIAKLIELTLNHL